ncbi:MAG: cell wall hydrolase, partial [Rhizobiaceae bacterium]|nr:cell wall hydrolase [Rhizobiaceae bacterium]
MSAPAIAGAGNIAGLSSSAPGMYRSYKQNNRMCLAMALYHEARGEPRDGQIAVGVTILNRVVSLSYPSSICGVVYENAGRFNKCQFSFACDRRTDIPNKPSEFSRMLSLSDEIIETMGINGEMPRTAIGNLGDSAAWSLFSTHYHRFDVAPSWSKRLEKLARISNHIFFRSERVVKKMPQNARDGRKFALMTKIHPSKTI